MRLMALDFGSKRVGVASTDESGQFALPRLVFPNDKDLLEKVVKFKEENAIERVVMGESKGFDGSPNPIMKEVEKFKSTLESKGVEVVWHPEVYTTQEAVRLQGENEMVDASAAALILRSYISSH